ncbi:MAG: flagellar M-ring protein FliF, partial [Proteobacteria bacterium]|nr:flagellar M-ring protein FliF [Pseudomonadota bacterium]
MNRASAMVLLGLASLLIVAFIVMALRVTTAAMAPLYTGLTLEDSARIVAELEKNGTPYELLANGSQIMVPNDRLLRMRMTLASQGLPATGSIVGYEIFDRSDTLGSSSFVMNINMMRALEGELSRTIGSIANVDTARVHLVFAKREIFSREKDKPTASVTVKMRGGKSLDNSEVTSITHLVASAVPGLDASHVTVVDSHGRLLARGDGDTEAASASRTADLRNAFEARMQENLQDLIEKVIGAGKVRVQVNADMNFDRVVRNSEKYDPDGQVARSVQSNSERGNSQEKAPKENVSVTGNLPQGSFPGDNGGSSSQITEQAGETTNYEISKTVENFVSEGGTVKKLSVAVLLDGTYTGDDEKYTPRTEEELKQIKNLVSTAIGFDEKRGDKLEVVNMRFTTETFNVGEESVFQKFKFEAQSIIQTLIIAVVAILAILLVLRPAVTTLIKQSQANSARVS